MAKLKLRPGTVPLRLGSKIVDFTGRKLLDLTSRWSTFFGGFLFRFRHADIYQSLSRGALRT